MKKENLLVWCTGILLVLNIGLIGILAWGMKRKPALPPAVQNEMEAERLIAGQLNLDKNQIEAFRRLKRDHRIRMDELKPKLNILQTDLFSLLESARIDTQAKQALLKEIEQTHTLINEAHLQHFTELKEILTPDQKALFGQFVGQMSRRFMPEERHKHEVQPNHSK